MRIEFWLEFGSTYSYPAAMRIESLAAEKGVAIVWRAFLLGAIFNDQGWNDSPFNIYPSKGAYMWRDMERVCAAQGIPFQRPSVFPRNGLLASRIVCRYADAAWLPDFIRRVYQTNFAEDRDISSREVILDCLGSAGESATNIIQEAESAENKLLLRKQTDIARQKGLFGAPSFLVGDELFWGNDRLEDAINWAATPAT